ncbi:hypothetical protein JVT61DRAFT_8704 [Boletus reticuloceps]|uniref:Uncharacterized protein n=1 Tax=Boletus reticuloceps TaxID=495285 RepID=A0A8I2YGW6_9AGAM|nr:hypothetical protein JVT61DRAFT_8704 [Boletus reticuloceps]
MEDLGVEGAVNWQLEVRLGHRRDGPVVFRERGPGLTEVVTVLESHLAQLSGSMTLLKRLDDLIEAAIQAYQKARCPLLNVPGIELDTPAASNDSAASNASGPTRTGKLNTKILQSFKDPDYVDVSEIEDSRKSGGKMLPLLVKVSHRCRKKDYSDREKQVDRIRCIGSQGCHMSWVYPRNRQRILGHVSKCNWLPTAIREAALAQMSDSPIGPDAIVPDSESSGLKRKASELDEEQDLDVAGLGGGPLQPRPFNPHFDYDSESESDPAARSNSTLLGGTDQIRREAGPLWKGSPC